MECQNLEIDLRRFFVKCRDIGFRFCEKNITLVSHLYNTYAKFLDVNKNGSIYHRCLMKISNRITMHV